MIYRCIMFPELPTVNTAFLIACEWLHRAYWNKGGAWTDYIWDSHCAGNL